MGTESRGKLPWMGIVALLLVAAAASRGAEPVRAEVVEEAVNFTALQPGQQAVAAVVLEIKPGFHAQSHTPSEESYIKFEATPESSPAIHWLEPVYPPGQQVHYAGLGDLNVYTGRVTIYIPFEMKDDAAAGDLKLAVTLHLQICDEKVCYAPQKIIATIATSVVARGARVEPNKPELFKGFDSAVFRRSSTQPAAASSTSPGPGGGFRILGHELKDTSYGLAFAAAFIVGIIFNAVPCVLPVLPLKAIGFYEVSQHDRGKCLAFGAVFSAGIIASFGVLALLVVVTHKLAWGQLYSNVYFNIAIVAILVAMAVGTFGVFSVNLPPAIYNITPRHDTFLGNFEFGILTAVLSTPCTFGLFLTLLVWASKQSPLVGTALVMNVGAGMAFPYFLLSAFPELARRFPRGGAWADLVKQMMAFLLFGSAVFFAKRFIQPISGADGFWWVMFAVVVIAGVYMVARAFSLSSNLRPRLVCAVIALLILVPSFFVTRWLTNQPYTWAPYSPQTLADARKSNHVVVVEFTATWCTNCQWLEKWVLDDPQVVKAVKSHDVQMIRADLTDLDAAGWTLLKELSPIAAVPFTAVYLPNQDQPLHLTGVYSVKDLQAAITESKSTTIASR